MLEFKPRFRGYQIQVGIQSQNQGQTGKTLGSRDLKAQPSASDRTSPMAIGAAGCWRREPRSLSVFLLGHTTGSSSLLESRLNSSHSPMAVSGSGAGVFPSGENMTVLQSSLLLPSPLFSLLGSSPEPTKDCFLALVISVLWSQAASPKHMHLYLPPLPSYLRPSLPHQSPGGSQSSFPSGCQSVPPQGWSA